MNKSAVAATAALAFLVSGCATIVNGTKQPVSFNSTPEGAEVIVNGASRGVTPTTVELPRGSSNANVEFKKDGYEVADETLHSSISGYYFLNILLGGIIGLALDAIDGAWYGYDDDLHANLVPMMAAAPAAATPVSTAALSDRATLPATTARLVVAPERAPTVVSPVQGGRSAGYNPNSDADAINRQMP